MDDPRVDVHSLSRRSLEPLKPVKAVPTRLARSMRPQEALRALLLDCLAQITANAAALRPRDSHSAHSVEALHQLRVAFRRLDTALDAFGREFGQDRLKDLRGRGKVLTARLSPARDLDVFIEKRLTNPRWGAHDGLPQLKARAERARDAAWTGVSTCIGDFERFADDVAALAAAPVPLRRDRSLSRAARSMLERQHKRVRKRGKVAASRKADPGNQGDLHRLRIGLKKLRYTCEFFASLYPRKKVGRYLKTLRALQNQLGDLNDAANVRATVGVLMQEKKLDDAAYAAGVLVGWYGAQAPRAAAAALKRYAKFRKVKPFWR